MLITKISSGTVYVKRGVLGTLSASHLINKLVRTVSVVPVELRRPSILRASGHTFEYTGFGPGNYSTAMPTNQTKVLNDSETSISQSLSNRGGSVLYTGMNSKGEYFIGKKKFNASTGEEIPTGGSSAIVSENLAKSSFDNLYVNNLFVNTKLDASTANVSAGSLDVTGITTFQNNLMFANPNTYIRWDANTDYAFIRFNSTSDSTPPSQLEIAVGDNGEAAGSGIADNLVVNQYAADGTIARTLKLLDNYGNTVIPGNLGIG